MNTGKNSSSEFVFENRPYHEDCSELVKEAIRNRVSFYDSQILLITELPVSSTFTIDFLMNEVVRKGKTIGDYGLIIDVRQAQKPNAETRRKINEKFGIICNDVMHVSFCTGKSRLLNTIVKFVMYHTSLKSYSFNSSLEDCVADIKKVMNG